MKDSIKTKSFVYVYLVILACLSILISCGGKENSNQIPNNHIPNQGSNLPEEQSGIPTNRESNLGRLYDALSASIQDAVWGRDGLDNYLEKKSRLNKEEFDRELKELEEKQKQMQEKFSDEIRRLSLANPKIKLSEKFLYNKVFNSTTTPRIKLAKSPEGKELYQKIEDGVKEQFDIVWDLVK